MSSLKNTTCVDYVPTRAPALHLALREEDPGSHRVSSPATSTRRPSTIQGKLDGWEIEARQDLGKLWTNAEGFSVGANATFIDSTVDLPQDEIDKLAALEVNVSRAT
jgi:hypothetical protein